MKYRKKPVVVEAVKWDGSNLQEVKDFVGKNFECIPSDTALRLIIHTLEGDHVCSEGDFIIKGVKGEFYPCKPDIFEQTYESAEDADEDGEEEPRHIYTYFTPYEDLSASLKLINDALGKIDSHEWNAADQHKRDLMTKEVLEPLNLNGKLSDAEADYLEDCNFHTALCYLTSE